MFDITLLMYDGDRKSFGRLYGVICDLSIRLIGHVDSTRGHTDIRVTSPSCKLPDIADAGFCGGCLAMTD
ncbi:hypothetical protein D3C71_2125220 [compost metagenome]